VVHGHAVLDLLVLVPRGTARRASVGVSRRGGHHRSADCSDGGDGQDELLDVAVHGVFLYMVVYLM
jgi:hypothetical protein